METRARSWAKSVTWRVIGIVLLGGIAYLFTGDLREMTYITVLFHSIRLVLFYVHERWWLRVSWGRVVHPLEKIAVKRPLNEQDLELIKRELKQLGYL